VCKAARISRKAAKNRKVAKGSAVGPFIWDNRLMTANEISRVVVDCAVRIHTRLGPGLYESVYETLMVYELEKAGLRVQRQFPIPVVYDEIKMDDGFRGDLLVEGIVIVEIKSLEKLAPVHFKQVLTYLRCTGLQLGILLNFGEHQMKDGMKRIVNGLQDA